MNLNPLATTQTSNTIPITDIQVNDKKDSLTSTIKERLTSVKNFILTHKSTLAQTVGAASMAFGGVVLAATSCTPVGLPLLVVGGLLFVIGTGSVIHKKNIEGKAEGLGSKTITHNIIKTSLKNTFLGVAIGGLLGLGAVGSAAIPFLMNLQEKKESANEKKQLLTAPIEDLKKGYASLNAITDKALNPNEKVQQEKETTTPIKNFLTQTNVANMLDDNNDGDFKPNQKPSNLQLDVSQQNLLTGILDD